MSHFLDPSILGPPHSHLPSTPYQLHQSYNMTTPSHLRDQLTSNKDARNVTWYPDSGAINHLTADPNLVHEPVEKFGHEHIYMGY
ncbi:hypothetical protein Lalb_Chr05g0226761 [Lupinus albus]|uniref:Uncharacterized protein n=1 Tax=Lupinus albus TaxID=3870 RepID=A0A6A4QLD3_LUPAL|nr:hypothetical protein Lalb_Chr05g0226761 [Lupinus albus]